MESSGSTQKVSLDVGSILTHGWKAFAKNLLPLIIIQLTVAAVGAVVTGLFVLPVFAVLLITNNVEGGGQAMLIAALLAILILSFIMAFLAGGQVRVYLKAARGQTVEFGDLLSGRSLWVRMMPLTVGLAVLTIILGVFPDIVRQIPMLPVALFLLVLFLLVAFGLTFFFIVDANAGTISAMSKSWTTVIGNIGPVLLVLAVLFAIAVLLAIVSYIAVLRTVIGFAGTPFFFCVLATLYDRLTSTAP